MASEWKWSAVSLLCLTVIILWLLSREEGVSTSPVRWATCLLLPVFISLYGMRRKSLDFSGGMLAILVGFILTAASACFCASLLVFFITSSRLTKWKGKEKQKFEGDYKEGGHSVHVRGSSVYLITIYRGACIFQVARGTVCT